MSTSRKSTSKPRSGPSPAPLVAGVDLGGTKIQAVVTVDGSVAGSSRRLTPQTGVDAVIAAIVGAVEDSLLRAGLATSRLGAIGIGTPGEIDAKAGVVSRAANVPGFLDRI